MLNWSDIFRAFIQTSEITNQTNTGYKFIYKKTFTRKLCSQLSKCLSNSKKSPLLKVIFTILF